MQDVVTKRFIICHNELVTSKRVKSSRQFAISLDYLPQSLSEIIRGRRKVTLELARKAVEKYNINPTFLLKGEGHAFNEMDSADHQKDVLVVVSDSSNSERIVHVPISAQAGYGGQLTSPEYISDLPSYSLPDPYFQTGTFRSFDVAGDSMEPTLFHGERVVCSYVEQDIWNKNIKDGHVYVVITDEDILVKRIRSRLDENGTYELISDNEDYPTRTLNGNEIKEIWFVKLKISPFISSPSNLRNGLHNEIDGLKETINQQNSLIQSLNTTIERMLKQNRSR